MVIRTQQLVDDLLWSIQSPSLVTPAIPAPDELVLNSETVEQLHQKFNDSPHFKVGRYFESLVEFWLRNVCQLEVLEHQKQIFAGTRTLGEIDFLYRNQSGNVVHLETAVKFYLHYVGEHHSGSHFIGPNSNDNLEAKHTRLFQRQLKLAKEHFSEVSQSEALVKGRIFYRRDSQPPVEPPSFLAENHLKGYWLYADELEWLDRYESDAKFYIIRKPHWLADIMISESDAKLTSKDELNRLVRTHFRDAIRPLLVARLEQHGESWVEVNRFFIMHPGWPHLKNR